MFFKLAYRNIIRNKRRSILTALAMIFGFFLTSVSISVGDGMYSNIIDTFTKSSSGHLQINHSDYLENPSIYKTINSQEKIDELLNSTPEVKSYTKRVYTGGLSFFKNKTAGIEMIGIDPVGEFKTTSIKFRIKEGEYFKKDMAYETIISKSLSQTLKINIGDDLVVISQSADGSIANDMFKVVAIAQELGKQRAYIPLKALQEFLVLGSRVHKYVIIGQKQQLAKSIAANLQTKIANYSVDPWQVVKKDFYKAMLADMQGNYIFLFIIIFIVAIGVLNTVLMNILERTREFGVLKAIGTRPIQIFLLIVSEVFILALISCVIGSFFSFGVNYYFAEIGYQYPTPITFGGMVIDTMYGIVNMKSFLLPALIIFFTSMLVSVFPGIKASAIAPVKAMRDM